MSAAVGAEWSATLFSELERDSLRRDEAFDPVLDRAGFDKWEQLVGGEIAFSHDPIYLLLDGGVGDCEAERCDEIRVREGYLEQAWDPVNVTVGRRIVRWGTGYIDRPTSLLEGAVRRNDPEDWRQRLVGADTFLIEWFREVGTVSFGWVRGDQNELERNRPHWVVRYDTLIRDTDVALVGSIERPGVGFAMSRVFGEALELHADVFAQQGTERRYHRALFESEAPMVSSSNPNVSLRSGSDKFFVHSVVGGQYTVGGVNIILEWLHDERGLTNGQFDAWRELVRFHHQLPDTQSSLAQPAAANLLWDLETLREGGAMQDYLFLRVADNAGAWRPELNLFVNADDRSFVAAPKLRFLRDKLDVQLSSEFFQGDSDTEFGSNPVDWSFNLHMRYRLF